MSIEVTLVRTGTSNLASVIGALERVGARVRVSSDPSEVRQAGYVVLPGVGSFAAAQAELSSNGLIEPLIERIEQDLPTLTICLGLQLLARSSAEAPDVSGLGVLPATVERFDDELRRPQLGWNWIAAPEGSGFVESGFAYFANSYHIPAGVDGWRATLADYGGPFVAAVERGNVVACQFHPELSGEFGQDLLARWLKGDPTC